MNSGRRRLLEASGAFAGIIAAWPTAALSLTKGATPASSTASPRDSRSITLANLHTGERLKIEYFRAPSYVPDAMVALQVLLRDFRTGEQHSIDPKLMDYLVDVAQQLGVAPEFSVISGYRSPETNARLHSLSSAVSQHSLHMQGRAIDVRMKGVDCAQLATSAISLKQGGVGYYRESNFVHLDTGSFRTWRG